MLISSAKSLSTNDMSVSPPPKTPFASGTITSSSGIVAFTLDDGTSASFRTAQVTGLVFTPKRIVLVCSVPDTIPTVFDTSSTFGPNAASKIVMNTYAIRLTGTAVVSATGFTLPVNQPSTSYQWYAYA